MGTFLITRRKNLDYQYVLKADNGEVILSSEGYYSKSACLNGISSIKMNSKQSSRFDRIQASDGRYYFNLKASNGQIIGSSQLYSSSSGRDNGIEIVMKIAETSDILDTTI